MKYILSIFFILQYFLSCGQKVSVDQIVYRHFIGGQIGGQTLISVHYEYSLINKKHFLLNTNLGFGLNQSGDAEINVNAIWGIHTGITSLFRNKTACVELGINPTSYFYGNTSFVNLNSWFGLRYLKENGFYIGAGFTPIIYTSFSDPNNHFVNTYFGLKLGGNF